MSTAGHQEVRQALGAYSVGALDAEERGAVDDHLADCPACRDELAALAVLPGLLGRLSADEAASGLLATDAGRAERAIAAAADAQRAARRRLRTWQAAAVAAAVGLVAVLLVPLAVPGSDAVLPAQPVATDAVGLEGHVSVTARPWGMEVEAELRGLPERRGYTLVAVRADDHRAVAASWSATEAEPVRLTGACYVDPADLVRLEIMGPDDEVLATFEV